MDAEYRINVGDGIKITATGDVDKLDEMCERLQAYEPLRALLAFIHDNAEPLPVPGGTQYTIDGETMRRIAEVVK